MIDTPQVVQTGPVPCARIHLTIPKDKIREMMGPGYAEVMEALKVQGITPTGPWFTHHFRMDPEVWDFEICAPVASPVKPSGRVQPGELPGAKAVRTVYHGGYEGLPEAWGEFDAWISKNGHSAGPGLWEVYTVGPESGNDPSKWQTELYRPLAT